ncbi:hypothetical protein THAOC_08599, partial [Thalassiosira oceanica]
MTLNLDFDGLTLHTKIPTQKQGVVMEAEVEDVQVANKCFPLVYYLVALTATYYDYDFGYVWIFGYMRAKILWGHGFVAIRLETLQVASTLGTACSAVTQTLAQLVVKSKHFKGLDLDWAGILAPLDSWTATCPALLTAILNTNQQIEEDRTPSWHDNEWRQVGASGPPPTHHVSLGV